MRAQFSIVAIAITLTACANGLDDGTTPGVDTGTDAAIDDAPANDDGAIDSNASTDAPSTVDSNVAPDTFAPIDSPNGLDPGLALPGAGQPCNDIGSTVGCPGNSVCRISSTTGGTCESCVGCGNLGASCRNDVDCDILFQCFNGKCEGFCALGSSVCGTPSDCIDVGNETTGVCKPL